MRLLKKKMALKQMQELHNHLNIKLEDDFLRVKQEDFTEIKLEHFSNPSSDYQIQSQTVSPKIRKCGKRGPRKTITSPDSDSKNIIKNFGKALCAFASSKLGLPYIESAVSKGGYRDFDIQKFMEHMRLKKASTNSIQDFRQLLIEEEEDSEQQKIYKKVFKDVSIVFMKSFAVNWIFHSRLVHKKVHLQYRFRMLRRIRDPENFTYLKTYNKKLQG